VTNKRTEYGHVEDMRMSQLPAGANVVGENKVNNNIAPGP